MNVGKGSRQNGSVTSEKGLALRTEHGNLVHDAVSGRMPAKAVRAAMAGLGGELRRGSVRFGGVSCARQSAQNWNGQGESDCLIKTKHCDGLRGCLRNVTSAQCSECQSEEIQPSAGKRRE